jgi:hypothetical protein
MSTSYPGGLDSLTNPTPTTYEDVLSHASQHANANDAIEALEAQVGVTGSAVTASVNYRVAQLQNSRTFNGGVVTVGPNGTGADYATIQAAIDALTTGGTIKVMAGTYTVTQSILFKYSNTIIEGVGYKTIIQGDGAIADPLIGIGNPGIDGCGLNNVKLNQTNVTPTGVGLGLGDTALFNLGHVYVYNFATGLSLNDTINITFYNVYRDLAIFACNTGIAIVSTNPVNDNLFENTRIAVNASGTGLHITNGQGNVFMNLNTEPGTTSSTTGIKLETAATVDTTFIGAWVEGNNLGVSIDADVLRTKFIGCSLGYNTTNITDVSPWTMYLSCRDQDALKNDIRSITVPVNNATANDGVTVNIDNSVATVHGLKIINAANFAHTGAFAYLETINTSDSANVVQVKNRGTGFSFLGQDGSANNTFSVTKTGNVRSLGSIVGKQIALTDSASTNLDASLGDSFYLSATGDRTILTPTNATEAQIITINHFASGGNRTLALTVGSAGAFRFNTTYAALSATTSGKNDIIQCRYNSTDDRWDVINVVKGA